MKVNRLNNGNVTIELESPEEVITLWAVSGHIRGKLTGPAQLFFDHDAHGGLHRQLSPFVAAEIAERQPSPHRTLASPTIREAMAQVCRIRLLGKIEAVPLISDEVHRYV